MVMGYALSKRATTYRPLSHDGITERGCEGQRGPQCFEYSSNGNERNRCQGYQTLLHSADAFVVGFEI